MKDYIFRFFVGGVVVSAFAALADSLKPKSFAGLFGAAPSIALATLGLAIVSDGKEYAAVEARSMIGGVTGFLPARLFLYLADDPLSMARARSDGPRARIVAGMLRINLAAGVAVMRA